MSWLQVSAFLVASFISIYSYSNQTNYRATSSAGAKTMTPKELAQHRFLGNAWQSLCIKRSNQYVHELREISQRFRFQISYDKKHALMEYFFYKGRNCSNLVDRREVVLDVKRLKFRDASNEERPHYYYEFRGDHVFVQQSRNDEPENWDFDIQITDSPHNRIYIANGSRHIELRKNGRVARNGYDRFGRARGDSAHQSNGDSDKKYQANYNLRSTQRALYSGTLPIPDLFPNQAMGMFLRMNDDFQDLIGPNFTSWNRESEMISRQRPFGRIRAEQRANAEYTEALEKYNELEPEVRKTKKAPTKKAPDYPQIRMSVLVTAFGKWKRDRSKNGSKLVAEELARQIGNDPNWDQIDFRYCVLDVDYKLAAEQLARCYSQMNPRPSYVFSLGESSNIKCDAGEKESFRIDVLGKNFLKGRSIDTVQYSSREGKGKGDIWAGDHLPEVISTNIPFHEAYCSMNKNTREAFRIDYDSGSYVCNTTSYQMLMTLKMFPELDTRFSFIHTPTDECLKKGMLSTRTRKLKKLLQEVFKTTNMSSMDYAAKSKQMFHSNSPRFPIEFPGIKSIPKSVSDQIKQKLDARRRYTMDIEDMEKKTDKDAQKVIRRLRASKSRINAELNDLVEDRHYFKLNEAGTHLIYEHRQGVEEYYRVEKVNRPGQYERRRRFVTRNTYDVVYDISTQTHSIVTKIQGYPRLGPYYATEDGRFYYDGRDGTYVYDLDDQAYYLITEGGYIDFVKTGTRSKRWEWTQDVEDKGTRNPLLSDRNKCMSHFFESVLEGKAKSERRGYMRNMSDGERRRREGETIHLNFDRDMYPTD